MAAPRTSSVSPSRTSLPQHMAALGARLSRGLSRDGSVNSSERDRSISRGREAFHSSGRGGYGNIHRGPGSTERPADGPDDFSPARGREMLINGEKVTHTGRGGAGNIRSPSRKPTPDELAHEVDVLKQHAEVEKTAIRSSGRGGMGNIRARSQDVRS